MLSLSCREEILRKYLENEEKRKCKPKQMSIEETISLETCDTMLKNRLLTSLVSNTDEWMKVLFLGGYISPYWIPKSFHATAVLRKRKEAVLKRYTTWKRLRPYLKTHGLKIDTRMYPARKVSVFQFHSKETREVAYMMNLFVQMIATYLPLSSIYQYDPVYGAGYRYYSGEPIVVYYATDATVGNREKMKRLHKAILTEKANGYDMTRVKRVILCNYDWQLKTGDKSCACMTISPYGGDVREQILRAWKQYYGKKPLFDVFRILNYVNLQKTLPWPFQVKDGMLELLDCTTYHAGARTARTSDVSREVSQVIRSSQS